MSESPDNPPGPREIRGDASPIFVSVHVGEATGEVTPADRIEVEDADHLKYLRLRAGDFELPQAVFLVINGARHEITQDSLPEEGPEEG